MSDRPSLTDFADGEGSFTIMRQKTWVKCRFRIQLREDDDEVLREIKERTGLGHIGYSSNGTSHDHTYWCLYSKAD